MLISNEIWSLISIILTVIIFYSYIRSVLYGDTRPHLFSWIIWGVSTTIVAFAQYADGAGVSGALPILLSGVVALYVAYLAYKKRTNHMINPIDWVFMTVALLAIPIWWITDNPLWAALLLTTIDVIGSFPTIRKLYSYPNEEPLKPYVIGLFRNVTALFALEKYNVTTTIFPIATAIPALIMIIIMLRYRVAK